MGLQGDLVVEVVCSPLHRTSIAEEISGSVMTGRRTKHYTQIAHTHQDFTSIVRVHELGDHIAVEELSRHQYAASDSNTADQDIGRTSMAEGKESERTCGV